MPRLGSIFAAVGAGSRSLQEDRAREKAEQVALEDRLARQAEMERRRTLEEALEARRVEEHGADMRARSLDEIVKQDAVNNLGKPKVTPSQRTYDATRGVIVDEIEGKALPVQGLPARQPTEAQSAAQEGRRLDRTRDLRADYEKSPPVKAGHELARVAGGIKAGLAGQTPMDDLSLIYETVKLFDPASVVREGEIKLFQSAASLPLQLRLMVEKWNSGKLLTPGMRAHIAALVDRKVGESRSAVEPVQADFGKMAREYGVQADSAFIAPDPFRGVKADKRSRLPNR